MTVFFSIVCGNRDESFILIAKSCPKLATLSVCSCKKITELSLIALAQHCPELRKLYVCNCEGLIRLPRELIENCPKLDKLRTSGTNIDEPLDFIRRQGLDAIKNYFRESGNDRAHQSSDHQPAESQRSIRRFPNYVLSVIDLNRIPSGRRVTDSEVIPLLNGELTNVILDKCIRLTGDSIMALARICPNLITLSLCSCDTINSSSLTAVAKTCTKLTNLFLDFTMAGQLEDEPIIAVAENCTQLTTLSLKGCEELTDISVLAVARNLHELVALDLQACEEITMLPRELFENFNLQKLKTKDANIKDPPLEIRRQGLDAMRQYFLGSTQKPDTAPEPLEVPPPEVPPSSPSLLPIDGYVLSVIDKDQIPLGNRITDRDLIPILRPELSKIILDRCTELTDHSIITLAQMCPALEILSLCSCVQLTEKSLIALARHCHHLSQLYLRY